MVRWGDEKTLQFVQMYRAQACLWDRASPQYRSRGARQRALAAIVAALNRQHFGLTLDSAKMKIKNLRTTYHMEARKARRAPPGRPYRPRLPWFYEMDAFLGDVVDVKDEPFLGDRTVSCRLEEVLV